MVVMKKAFLVVVNSSGEVWAFAHASGDHKTGIDTWFFTLPICEIQGSELHIL